MLTIEKVDSALRANEPKSLSEEGLPKSAAVATILKSTDRGVSALFIRRALFEGDPWSGHMAFPGGRAEAHDAALIDTAIRETREEIGLVLSPDRCLGCLSDLQAVNRSGPTGLMVRPFVFSIDEAPELVFNHEVAEALWFDVDTLRSGQAKAEFRYERDGQVMRFPAFDVDRRIVWGLTYRMLQLLFEALASSE